MISLPAGPILASISTSVMYGPLRFVRLFPTFLQKKKTNGTMNHDVVIKPALGSCRNQLGKEGIGRNKFNIECWRRGCVSPARRESYGACEGVLSGCVTREFSICMRYHKALEDFRQGRRREIVMSGRG